jgi:c-di-GMP-binding flagellar brake protein YcgR
MSQKIVSKNFFQQFSLTLPKKFSSLCIIKADAVIIFCEELLMKTEQKEVKPRYGIADFERRTYRRFPMRLPIEYYRANSPANRTGHSLDASEGGLQILFPEQVEVGQNLSVKVFFSTDSGLNTIEMVVEVVWINTQLAEGEKHYRTGVRFASISPENMTKLREFSSVFL